MLQSIQPSSAIHFTTFLSPVLYRTYEYIAEYVGKQIGRSTPLHIGQSLEEFSYNTADVGFLCGLQYVHMKKQGCPVELLVAPILQGERYQHRPIYYSDIIVHSESPFSSFKDLQGCIWAYNEQASHSGYNLVYYSLLERNETLPYFGQTLATGSHLQSLEAVLSGKAHASAIDSHLLDVLQQERPEITAKIRIIDSFGPSTIPPLVIASRLDKESKCQIQQALISMHNDHYAVNKINTGCIERFTIIQDNDYDDIRLMFKKTHKYFSYINTNNL